MCVAGCETVTSAQLVVVFVATGLTDSLPPLRVIVSKAVDETDWVTVMV